MDHLTWNKFLDNYLINGTMSASDYEELNEMQVLIVQEIKKSLKRINKPEVNNIHHSLCNS